MTPAVNRIDQYLISPDMPLAAGNNAQIHSCAWSIRSSMKKSLIKIFKRKPQDTRGIVQATDRSDTPSGLDGFVLPKTAEELLGDERRQILMDNIWEQTSVSKESFSRLYYGPISRYAELVQQLPASENHHHSYLGGMLDHGLELILYALKLRQGYLLPIGVSPEDKLSCQASGQQGLPTAD